MNKKKWAMVIMGEDYTPEKDNARINKAKKEGHILTVKNPDEAIELAKRLKEEGFGAIEVCGAFGEKNEKRMYEATDKTVPVCYVVTPEEELPQAIKFWSEE